MTVDSSEYHNPSAGNRIVLLSSLVAKRKYQTAWRLSNDFQKKICAVLISKSIRLIIYVFNCNHLSFFKNQNESKIALPAL